MKTAIRRPKINKPTKGMKTFFKQQRKSLIKAMHNISGLVIPNQSKQKWLTPKASRARWLLSHNRSGYMPHQGHQEKARRIKQVAAGTLRPF